MKGNFFKWFFLSCIEFFGVGIKNLVYIFCFCFIFIFVFLRYGGDLWYSLEEFFVCKLVSFGNRYYRMLFDYIYIVCKVDLYWLFNCSLWLNFNIIILFYKNYWIVLWDYIINNVFLIICWFCWNVFILLKILLFLLMWWVFNFDFGGKMF